MILAVMLWTTVLLLFIGHINLTKNLPGYCGNKPEKNVVIV
jgi:hypothetical protein